MNKKSPTTTSSNIHQQQEKVDTIALNTKPTTNVLNLNSYSSYYANNLYYTTNTTKTGHNENSVMPEPEEDYDISFKSLDDGLLSSPTKRNWPRTSHNYKRSISEDINNCCNNSFKMYKCSNCNNLNINCKFIENIISNDLIQYSSNAITALDNKDDNNFNYVNDNAEDNNKKYTMILSKSCKPLKYSFASEWLV